MVNLGDFNSIVSTEDRLGGALVTAAECVDFKDALFHAQLQELQYVGWEFTWCNKQPTNLIYTKIDGCFGNDLWLHNFSHVVVRILNSGCSDHSPLLLDCGGHRNIPARRFKFLNCLVDHKDFLSAVSNGWACSVSGVPMYKVWNKLKSVRLHLSKLTVYYSIAQLKVVDLRAKVDALQTRLQVEPLNSILFQKLLSLLQQDYDKWLKIEEAILQQKSKIHWIKCGDGNNRFFHASLQSRSATGIHLLYDSMGNLLTKAEDIQNEVVSFYKGLLGSPAHTELAVDISILQNGPVLNSEQRRALLVPETAAEVWDAVNAIGDNKAPGADGFTAKFYKASWSIVGVDIIQAIQCFFTTGKMLKSVNTAIITLLPKSPTASTIREYRPIACCNVLYKIISKLLSD